MEQFTSPFKVKSTGVKSARLKRNALYDNETIELVVTPAEDGFVELSTNKEVGAGVWRLEVNADCGCWHTPVYVPCGPVAHAKGEGALGGSHYPDDRNPTSKPPIPTCP